LKHIGNLVRRDRLSLYYRIIGLGLNAPIPMVLYDILFVTVVSVAEDITL